MTTSGSTDYSVTAADLIRDALIEVSAIAPDEAVQADMQGHALRQLNQMVKHWQVVGHNLWTKTRDTLTLTDNKGADSNPYTFGPGGDKAYRPLRILGMRYRDASGIERPMFDISRSDYDDLPLKSTKSTPTQFHYNPQVGVGELYVWPLKSDGVSGEVVYTYVRPIEDFDVNSNTPDFPQEWYEALLYGLAARLAPSYYPQDANMQQRLIMTAQGKLQECLAFDVETSSTFIKPDRRYR